MRAAHSPSFGPGASLFSRQDVLRAVSTIAGDSKDFVDSPLKFSHSVVSAAFDALPLPHRADDVRVSFAHAPRPKQTRTLH